MKNKKVYIRLIWGYLAVFMIPLIMNVVLLEDIGNSTQENICKNVLMNLNHTKETIDNNFEEIDSIVEKLSANSTVFYERHDDSVLCGGILPDFPLQRYGDQSGACIFVS